jgi:sulfur-oxidizing protein SoxA
VKLDFALSFAKGVLALTCNLLRVKMTKKTILDVRRREHRRLLTSLLITAIVGFMSLTVSAQDSKQLSKQNIVKSVHNDVTQFQTFYKQRFPEVEFNEFANGVYAIDEASREQWLEIEDFPPYELSVDQGKEYFETPFDNGKSYADCFENGGIGIRQNFPFFDSKKEMVVTLELAINQCRIDNGMPPLNYKKGEIAEISAYMAYTSRGKTSQIEVTTKKAFKAYLNGKQFFYAKRGQLNFSCADCHMNSTGMKIRADITSPALGQTTGFPTYRSKWDEIGTLHWRYAGCNKNIRALPFAAQSEQYRDLEFFHSIMSRGLPINGPSSRK